MSTVDYDFGVELPPRRRRGPADTTLIVRDMPIGASKFFPLAFLAGRDAIKCAKRGRGCGKQNYACRKVTEEGVHGVRIWRLENDA